jgi:DNA processing protein
MTGKTDITGAAPPSDTTTPPTGAAAPGTPAPSDAAVQTGACTDCLRRSRLLAWLSPRLHYRSKDRERLIELLALGEEDLLRAVGGRRREELKARYAGFDPSEEIEPAEGVERVCRHDRAYPRALRDGQAPRMLRVAGGVTRLGELTTAPVVAIVGSRQATDYGMEMAKSLARGLAASGVTVASGLDDGIAVAAHAGALEVERGSMAVLPGGLDTACPARRRTLYARLTAVGCAIAELPCGSRVRRWCYTARAQTLAQLAAVTIVVEADEDPGELLSAHLAQTLGRTVAAVPGRVTSPVSRGTHALLMAGAQLVRRPEDVLELLYGMETSAQVQATQPKISTRRAIPMQREEAARQEISTPVGATQPEISPRANTPVRPRGTTQRAQVELEPRLRSLLERVGAGQDTPDKLAGEQDAGEVLMALSELELKGLLARGDGGRYVPRDALAVRGAR